MSLNDTQIEALLDYIDQRIDYAVNKEASILGLWENPSNEEVEERLTTLREDLKRDLLGQPAPDPAPDKRVIGALVTYRELTCSHEATLGRGDTKGARDLLYYLAAPGIGLEKGPGQFAIRSKHCTRTRWVISSPTGCHVSMTACVEAKGRAGDRIA